MGSGPSPGYIMTSRTAIVKRCLNKPRTIMLVMVSDDGDIGKDEGIIKSRFLFPFFFFLLLTKKTCSFLFFTSAVCLHICLCITCMCDNGEEIVRYPWNWIYSWL